MPDFSSSSFSEKELEISRALSTLKRHGLNIKLPESLIKQLEATTLFEGDDGLFKELIREAGVYFEYGCGKSSEYVFKHTTASIFSVDTSRDWARKIQGLDTDKRSKRLNVNWVDVGDVGDWGYPTSFKMRQNFKKYAELFWLTKKRPDLVLIDGRFRVFCFLTSLKFAPVGTKILFDDYTQRPFYHVVEEFAPKLATCGRQALFEATVETKESVTDEILMAFQNVIN